MKKKKQNRPCVPLGRDVWSEKGNPAPAKPGKPKAPDGVSGDWE